MSRNLRWARALLIFAAAQPACTCASSEPAATPMPAAPTRWHYDVALAADLGALDVRLTFVGAAPPWLVLGDREAIPYVSDPTANGVPLTRSGTAFDTRSVADGGTISYRVNLAAMMRPVGRRFNDSGAAHAVGRDVVVSPSYLLLRPANVPPDGSATLDFSPPPGVHLSAPWEPIPAEKTSAGSSLSSRFALPPSTFQYRGKIAFTHAEPIAIGMGDSVINLALLDRGDDDAARGTGISRQGAEAAIRSAADAVSLLYGGFPVARAQVVMEPVPGRQPVPFGMTLYGGGNSVHLFVGRSARDAALADDWTATHELTHLGMPSINPEDAWMSEGWVTYYTEVLRARTGLITEADAWKNLRDGFVRGGARETGKSLGENSATMDANHAYLPVYWGGAATAMRLDVALRRASNGAQTLDDAVRALHRAFPRTGDTVSASQCLLTINKALGTTLATDICGPMVEARRFPDAVQFLEELGVGVPRETVVIDDKAPLAAIRRAITAPAVGSPDQRRESR